MAQVKTGLVSVTFRQKSVEEIAAAVGFCNQSYFTDCFRKAQNITPKKYRELTLRKPKDILPLDIGGGKD